MSFISYHTSCLGMKMQYLNKQLELSLQSEHFSDNGIREVNTIKAIELQANPKNIKKIIKIVRALQY